MVLGHRIISEILYGEFWGHGFWYIKEDFTRISEAF